jgi:hypothetical protein
MIISFRTRKDMMRVLADSKELSERVKGLPTLPVTVIFAPSTFPFENVNENFRLRLLPSGNARIVVIAPPRGYKCFIAGVCAAKQAPKTVADLMNCVVAEHAEPDTADTVATRTLKELMQLIQTTQRNLNSNKYVGFRDDKVLALFTALNARDERWCERLRLLVQDSYRGFDESALQRRCDTFNKKLLKWRSESFVSGVRDSVSESLREIIESRLKN